MTDPRTMTDRELFKEYDRRCREDRLEDADYVYHMLLRRFRRYVEEGRVLPEGHSYSPTDRVRFCPCAARLDRLERAMREWAERSAMTKHIAKQIAGALGDQQANK